MPHTGGDVTVRDVRPDDRPGWNRLWAAYLAHYGENLPDAVTEATWRRVAEERGRDPRMGALVAVDAGGALVGLAQYVVGPSTWSTRDEAYLSDLVVARDARGHGVGHALIDALVARGRERGWRRVHWITQEDNTAARRLYDHVGSFAGFIQYEIELAD